MGARPLTTLERALLERMCEFEWPGAEAAREQLKVAIYAGPAHDGVDNCFDIQVLGDVTLIAGTYERPVQFHVMIDGDPKGVVGLWITDGLISSFEHSDYFLDSPPFPTPSQIVEETDPRMAAYSPKPSWFERLVDRLHRRLL